MALEDLDPTRETGSVGGPTLYTTDSLTRSDILHMMQPVNHARNQLPLIYQTPEPKSKNVEVLGLKQSPIFLKSKSHQKPNAYYPTVLSPLAFTVAPSMDSGRETVTNQRLLSQYGKHLAQNHMVSLDEVRPPTPPVPSAQDVVEQVPKPSPRRKIFVVNKPMRGLFHYSDYHKLKESAKDTPSKGTGGIVGSEQWRVA